MSSRTTSTEKSPSQNAAVQANVEAAKEAGLVYVSLPKPGIHRKKHGSGFEYRDENGKSVRDAQTLGRIKSLVIPPAWTEVWISNSPRGHIQAVGKDARGRTQYRYHPQWRSVRDEAKYGRMMVFGKALPKIRSTVRRHMKLPGLAREKVLASVVKLLETTLIRVGNDEYARTNRSYGLTTIHNKHVKVNGSKVEFSFRGKSGVDHCIEITDKRIAKIIRQCQELPEQELFEYIDDDGVRHDITSSDVNAYLKEITGQDFTAKDFRTWAGTVLASVALQEFEKFDSEAQAKRNIVAAIESVAKKLGNTKAVCRKCYVHPAVLDSYLDGTLAKLLKTNAKTLLKKSLHRLPPEEAAVLVLLERKLTTKSPSRKAA